MKKLLLACLTFLAAYPVAAQSLQPGLDPTFGKQGRVTDIIDSGTRYRDVTGIAIQPDGKIITTGQFILRFTRDGKPDSTFGGTGLLRCSKLTYPEDSYAKGVLLQPDGKIIITGTVHNYRMDNDTAVVIRLLPDGSIDNTFGIRGVAKLVGLDRFGMRMSIAGNADAAALQPDGKILVAGDMRDNFPYVIVARIDRHGNCDSSFGVGGYTQMKIGLYFGKIIGHGFGLLPDGRIAIGGRGADSAGMSGQFLVRFMPDGSPDTSLGRTGQRFPFSASYLREVIIQPDGKTLICVQAFSGLQAVIRFDPDGNIDPGYGDEGFCYLPGDLVVATALPMPDGKLLLGGALGSDYAVMRIMPDGKGIDSAFGIQGLITTDQSNYSYELLTAMALQKDGKIVAGGRGRLDDWNFWAASIIRYKADAYVGVPEIAVRTAAVSIYPNPAGDLVYLDHITPAELKDIEVYSIDGRLQFKLPGGKTNFSVSTLSEGRYLVKIKTRADGILTTILSVQR